MKANRLAMMVALGLGLVLAGRAEAQPQGCHKVHGQYLLTPVTPCSELACYEGDLVDAGFLSGRVSIKIVERDTELPGSIGIWAYSAETVITTEKHGTVTYENLGTFVPDPNSSNLLQNDSAVIVAGTDWFLDAKGHNSSLGFATRTLSQLSGEVSGEICFME